MKVELAVLLAGGAALASAQQSVWGQCGGNGYTGQTTCVAGSYCSVLNPYYSQCLPGAAATTTTTRTATSTSARTTTTSVRTTTSSVRTTTAVTTTRSTTTSARTTTSAAPTSGGTTKFKYFGVNESGGEFGDGAIPGQLGKDYTWPSPSSIDYFMSNGFNTFRVGTKMERISPPTTGGLTGPFNETYMAGFDSIVNYITGKGGYAIVDLHNYGRFMGNIITSTSDFKAFWTTFATRYKNNARVIYDVNNEFWGMDQTLVVNLNQAAIDAIRGIGATQLILVEGNSWTGAWTWISSGNAATMINLKDPLNNMAFEMHQYLDSDGSGTSAVCVSATIFRERLTAATQWCQQNNVKCFLGEIGAGTDSTCTAALRDGFTYMQSSGVWIGALWWAAGPWWGTYYQSIEPPSGPAVSVIVPLLKSFQ